jgi:hypothetical protein
MASSANEVGREIASDRKFHTEDTEVVAARKISTGHTEKIGEEGCSPKK